MTASAVAVIVVAAGAGTRLGADTPKAFIELAGVTLLERALEPVFAINPAQVIVVAPASQLEAARAITGDAAVVVAGAATRQGSVAAGLAVLEPGIRTVLVHDAARALTPAALFDRVASAVAATGHGIIPSLPVSDTIKRVGADAVVLSTVDRDELVAVQTPQGFPREQLVVAYASASAEHTDDAALYSAAGNPVEVVAGEHDAFKITTPSDLQRAEGMLGSENARTGVGIDVHAYDASQPLWLGGLYWPDEIGLAGHSDGDALSHAICDALLSAAGLGDIGSRFGTDDPRFEGAHGDVFIAETVALVMSAGYTIGNVAVQLVAEHPRIGPRRAQLESHLTALVGAPVSVSGTTSDGVGFTGRNEGVAAIANALLRRA
jgi:2-C-methyl-D-erythritol 4-phosphate cytidylyltransferase/2-C-methyl-D-erythritol 2,4-cyclodiphosphate synthase